MGLLVGYSLFDVIYQLDDLLKEDQYKLLGINWSMTYAGLQTEIVFAGNDGMLRHLVALANGEVVAYLSNEELVMRAMKDGKRVRLLYQHNKDQEHFPVFYRNGWTVGTKFYDGKNFHQAVETLLSLNQLSPPY